MRDRRSHCRRGSALLDVVVALVVLALAGVGLITVTGQTAHTMRSVRETEREAIAASAELDRLVAYDRAQLAAMIGSSVHGEWSIDVAAVGHDLYDVAVSRRGGAVPLLLTTAYRPDTADRR